MKQFDFWSHNPCGADGELSKIIRQRYRVEPWLPRELATIPVDQLKYLEVGCGQGVDSFHICQNLNRGCTYTAIDYSQESVCRARHYIDEAKELFDLQVIPDFSRGDALALAFEPEVFNFIYCIGVIHHTPDPQKAVDEIRRVLKKGGQARIFVYRRYSIKVGIAKILRRIQALADRVLSQDRVFFKLLRNRKSNFFGSMFLECFGVPWMEWYSVGELRTMFRDFHSVQIEPCGFNFPRFTDKYIDGHNKFGYFYKINVTK
jgi:SAM-dependent methyltransferase